jgi:hypothetical protein
MATFNELQHLDQRGAQELDDLKAWRKVTEAWIKERWARAEKVGSVVAPHEKPLPYLYGMF